MKRTIQILSLLFSVYSPLYAVGVILLRVDRGSLRYAWGLVLFLLISFVLYGETGIAFVGGSLLLYVSLHHVWVRLARPYSGQTSLSVYPIHPWLRRRITKLTGYRPVGVELYEIHIDPTLLKHAENKVQAGVKVLHDAKHFTEELRKSPAPTSVVGTTYEAKLAELATSGARKNIKKTVHIPNVCPLGSKFLYPKKEWDTFIWEIYAGHETDEDEEIRTEQRCLCAVSDVDQYDFL